MVAKSTGVQNSGKHTECIRKGGTLMEAVLRSWLVPGRTTDLAADQRAVDVESPFPAERMAPKRAAGVRAVRFTERQQLTQFFRFPFQNSRWEVFTMHLHVALWDPVSPAVRFGRRRSATTTVFPNRGVRSLVSGRVTARPEAMLGTCRYRTSRNSRGHRGAATGGAMTFVFYLPVSLRER